MKKNRKYYVMIFRLYLIVIVLYTFIATGMFFNFSSNTTNLTSRRDKKIMMNQIKENIDTKLTISNALETQILTSRSFSNLILEDGLEYLNKLELRSELNRIAAYFQSQGSSVAVMQNNDAGTVISPETVNHKNEFFKDMGYANADIDRMNSFFDNNKQNSQIIILGQSPVRGKTLNIIKKVLVYSDYEVILFYTFSLDHIFRNIDSSSSAVAIFDNNGIVASNIDPDDEQFQDTFSAERVLEIRDTIKRNRYIGEIDKNDNTIYITPSSVMDWEYVGIMRNNMPMEENLSILYTSILVYLFLFAIGFLITTVLAKKIYSPIRHMLSTTDFEEEDLKQGEFAAFEKFISKIRNNYEHLEQVVKNDGALLKENFLKDLLSGIIPKDEISQYLGKYKINWLEKNVSLALIDISNYDVLQTKIQDMEFYILRTQLMDFINEKMSVAIVYEIVKIDSRRFAVIFKNNDVKQLERILSETLPSVEYKTDIQLKAFIDHEAREIWELNGIYYNIIKTIDNSLVDKHTIIKYGDSVGSEDSYYYPIDIEKSLIESTVNGSIENTRNLLYKILNENFTMNVISNEAVQQFIFAITATFNRIFTQLNVKANHIFGDDFILYLELRACVTSEELTKKIIHLFSAVCEYVSDKSNETNTDISAGMITFIKENYTTDISLYDLAKEFNLSVNYISRLFKQATGENFKDYLNVYRVNHSKELLKDGSYTISQIAKIIGCNSSNTFIRIFKRYEGMTPGQYIDKIKSGGI